MLRFSHPLPLPPRSASASQDYFDIVKNPMDLGSVKKRLENSCYKMIHEFAADTQLCFDNAILYNGQESDVSKVAKEMKVLFEKEFAKLMATIDLEEEQRKRTGDACVLCGCERLTFEPPSYYCNGAACNGQRIRRNSYYFTGGRNQYHWCQQCYTELRDNDAQEFPEIVLYKKDLQKKKNDEMNEEPWVECDQCKRWVHQICALFNGRKNKGMQTIYHCPFCSLAQRAKQRSDAPPNKTLGAKDIRHTGLSQYIEKRVHAKLDCAYERAAHDKHITLQEVEKAPKVHVRQLSNIEKNHIVRKKMMDRCVRARRRPELADSARAPRLSFPKAAR